jgi:hypothetical protein
MRRLLAWGWLLLSASCTKPTPEPVPVVVSSALALDFPGATAFALQDQCSAGPECASSWLHPRGFSAQVLVMPLSPNTDMTTVIARLQQSATAQGGTSDFFPARERSNQDFFAQHGQQVGRMLLPQAEGREVAISYLLPSPDQQALHVLTSVVPATDQVFADNALRDLLAFATWTKPDPTPRR